MVVTVVGPRISAVDGQEGIGEEGILDGLAGRHVVKIDDAGRMDRDGHGRVRRRRGRVADTARWRALLLRQFGDDIRPEQALHITRVLRGITDGLFVGCSHRVSIILPLVILPRGRHRQLDGDRLGIPKFTIYAHAPDMAVRVRQVGDRIAVRIQQS